MPFTHSLQAGVIATLKPFSFSELFIKVITRLLFPGIEDSVCVLISLMHECVFRGYLFLTMQAAGSVGLNI